MRLNSWGMCPIIKNKVARLSDEKTLQNEIIKRY